MLALVLCLSVVATAFAKYDTIPFGEQSDSVRTMQKALKSKGFYKGTVDGKFGQATRSAVYRYQKSIGVKADGKPGNKTLTALYEGTSAINEIINRKQEAIKPKNPDTLCYGCEGARVKSLQKALKAAGYFKGSIDGKFGEMTELAVRKYQTARGMHVDGMAGKETLASLNRAQNKVKLKTSFLLTKGSRGDEVRTVQVRLGRMGYNISDPKGYFGDTTTSALRQYQQDNGQSVTGSMSESQYNSFIAKKI